MIPATVLLLAALATARFIRPKPKIAMSGALIVAVAAAFVVESESVRVLIGALTATLWVWLLSGRAEAAPTRAK